MIFWVVSCQEHSILILFLLHLLLVLFALLLFCLFLSFITRNRNLTMPSFFHPILTPTSLPPPSIPWDVPSLPHNAFIKTIKHKNKSFIYSFVYSLTRLSIKSTKSANTQPAAADLPRSPAARARTAPGCGCAAAPGRGRRRRRRRGRTRALASEMLPRRPGGFVCLCEFLF